MYITAILLLFLQPADEVTVGSKTFTESVILGEMVTQLIDAAGHPANHRQELGG